MRIMNKLTGMKKETMILLGLALVLVVYILARDTGRINYTVPVPAPLDESAINRLVISSPGADDIVFFKTDGDKWIVGSLEYPADSASVQRLLQEVTELKLIDMVAGSEGASALDLGTDKRYTLQAFSGQTSQREIFVGRPTQSNSFTSVMLPGDKNVYTVRGDLLRQVNKSESDFYSKVALEINRSSISRITINGPVEGVSTPLVFSKDTENQWTDSQGNVVEPSLVNGFISLLAPLRCTSFTDKPGEEPAWYISIQDDTGEHTISMWEVQSSGYPAVTSGYPHPVVISAYTGDQLLQKFAIRQETTE